MASKNFGAEMASERWSLESTVINTSSVTVVEGEAGEGAICGVSYQFQSVTVTTIGDLKNRGTHVTRLIGCAISSLAGLEPPGRVFPRPRLG